MAASPYQQRVLALVPAYREMGRVGPVVAVLREEGFEVLVVDDCSPDGTQERAEEAGARTVTLPINLGYGGALQTGYLYAMRNGFEAVVQLDADGQHDPSNAACLVAPILAGNADVVIGSRFLDGHDYPMPYARRIGRRLFQGLLRLFAGRSFSDPTSGYQALSREVVRLYCSRIFPEDYPDADMLVLLQRMGFRIQEIPVKMYPNPEKSMHSGLLRPIYYVFKVTLSLMITRIRRIERGGTIAS